MKTFPTKRCPLCNRGLIQKYEYPDKYSFRCSTQASRILICTYKDDNGEERQTERTIGESHYEVLAQFDSSTKKWSGTQTTILPPYIMINVSGTGRTTIAKWDTRKVILQIPLLLPDKSEEKLLFKLKTYVIFS